ncbi:hypothetical protein UNDYM_3854 [Undibacterium sp. YM2]|uniref:DUF4214 domain-containing protein n=1 Tax=Undibacterium sp. YM2 TaxID=2058625 RepID=UPI001331C4CB|nr:DUF4214 domain-containing protein [Undibacterium sp. YM2]BBB68107.1 hypothetical protein UNDYM_3854 [Undibacterium sp. YM2]
MPNVNITYNDVAGKLASLPLLAATINAAIRYLDQFVVFKGTIDILVNADTTATGRFSGSYTASLLGKKNGLDVYEASLVTESRTGIDPSPDKPDLIINIDPTSSYASGLYWDPNIANSISGTVDPSKVDAFTGILHELLHGMGFLGYRDGVGKLPGNYESVWDSFLTVNSNNTASLGGPAVLALLGEPVEVRVGGTQSIYHLGTGPAVADSKMPWLEASNFNGYYYNYGERYLLGRLELAMLQDMGWTLKPTTMTNVVNIWDNKIAPLYLVGWDTDEQIIGDSKDDRIEGRGGNDTLIGATGDDSLYGGAGNDFLYGDAGNDVAVFSGNANEYTATYNAANDSYTVRDSVSNRDGIDTIFSVENLRFADGTKTPASLLTNTIPGTGNSNTINGSTGNDTLTGTAGSDSINALAGDDSLRGGAGNDTLYGGDGTDTALFTGSLADYTVSYDAASASYTVADKVNGRDGTDTLYSIELLSFSDVLNIRPGLLIATPSLTINGGPYNDYLLGTTGNNTINGLADNDTLVGGAGDDSLYGGDGNDTANYSGNAADYSVTYNAGNASYTIQDKTSNRDGTDTLYSIEILSFADGSRSPISMLVSTVTGITINGSTGNEALAGTAGNDYLYGFAGNDTLTGGGGNDFLAGGDGLDTASFAGLRTGYSISKSKDGQSWAITDLAGSDGNDQLISIERLQFKDQALALDINGTAGQVYRLYQAAFDRKPDLVGLGYWINDMDKGSSLTQVAAGFFQSPEFQKLYGSNPSNATLVGNFYQNVLHRAPDQVGYDYWLNQLNTGKISAAGVLASFCDSPENQALVANSIQNGIDYTLWLA